MAARFAPMRSWMMALTLRSKYTPMAITWSAISSMTTALAQAMATSTPITVPSPIPTRSLGGEPVEQRFERRHVQVLVVGRVAHLHHRRGAAAGQTLDLLEGEAPVGRLLARPDVEAALDAGTQVIRSTERAGQVDAQLQVMPSLRLRPEHGVERYHRRHPRERDLHQLGDVFLHRQRQPAEFALRKPERREQCGAAFGVARQDVAILSEHGLPEPPPRLS